MKDDIENTKVYQSYLLRVWCVAQYGQTAYRTRLEDTKTGASQGFNSLEDLFTYLRKELPNASYPEME